jgi:coenzyme F420-reducing hydrogenase delta subunit
MLELPKIVLIGCARSAGVAVEEIEGQGALPANVEWRSVTCGGAIDELDILKAFEAGADRVMVATCCDGACRSLNGNRWAERRVAAVRATLEEVGVAGWRLVFHEMAPNMAADLLAWIRDFREPQPADVHEGGLGD